MTSSAGTANAAEVARRLGYRFSAPELLVEALTHRSAGGNHNERLEFLGDAVLNCVIAEALFERRPDAPEGDLSRLRAALVREATLEQLAVELELGSFLRLGSGEIRSGGFRRASILADGVEAVIGAVYRDGGFEAARSVLLGLYARRLEDLPSADQLKDAKTRLQEWLQARGRPLPVYELVETSGVEHARHFVARCALPDADLAVLGEGRGRRRAEQAAAQGMLEALSESESDD